MRTLFLSLAVVCVTSPALAEICAEPTPLSFNGKCLSLPEYDRAVQAQIEEQAKEESQRNKKVDEIQREFAQTSKDWEDLKKKLNSENPPSYDPNRNVGQYRDYDDYVIPPCCISTYAFPPPGYFYTPSPP